MKALREARLVEGKAATPGRRRGIASGWQDHPANFSQHAMAERLGYTQSWLAKIEQGNRPMTVAEAYLIASELKVSPAAILGAPSKEEAAQMQTTVEDIQRARRKAKITPTTLAAETQDAANRRRRSSPRTPRELERLQAARSALGDATRRRER